MELSDVASVSGKGGLFKIVKPTRNGVILESMDEKKAKMIATANHRVSSLQEISIYTTDAEGSVPLEDIFKKIYTEFDDDPGLDSSSSPQELKSFLEFILPDYDRDKVYVSDIKRLVNWYHIIYREAPEILKNEGSDEKGSNDAPKDEPES